MRLLGLDLVVEPLDKAVHVLAPPVVAPERLAGGLRPGVRVGVGELDPPAVPVDGVRVEVVVEVDPVDVVAADDVEDHVERVVGGVGLAGVEPHVVAVGPDEVGPLARDVGHVAGAVAGRVPGAVRVDPRVELEPARVRLVNGELERVVPRIRRASLAAGQVLGPRLLGRKVEGVGGGADLEHDSVEAQRLGPVEERDQLGLLLGRGEAAVARPVDVGDGGDPGRAELAGRPRQRRRVHDLAAAERVGGLDLDRRRRRGGRDLDDRRRRRREVDGLGPGAGGERQEGGDENGGDEAGRHGSDLEGARSLRAVAGGAPALSASGGPPKRPGPRGGAGAFPGIVSHSENHRPKAEPQRAGSRA